MHLIWKIRQPAQARNNQATTFLALANNNFEESNKNLDQGASEEHNMFWDNATFKEGNKDSLQEELAPGAGLILHKISSNAQSCTLRTFFYQTCCTGWAPPNFLGQPSQAFSSLIQK